MTLSSQLTALLALTTGIGWLMIVVGVLQRMLEWRHEPPVCPGCGRRVRHGRCGCESESD